MNYLVQIKDKFGFTMWWPYYYIRLWSDLLPCEILSEDGALYTPIKFP